MSRALAIAIGVLLLVPTTASAEELARVTAPSPVSAYGGRALWSARDQATGRYQLMTWFAGTASAVPVPTRSVPFDADLGPNVNGATVAVYSRCARDPVADGRSSFGVVLWGSGRGCDIYEYEFDKHRERKLSGPSSSEASEFLPSVWRSQIAFARTYDDKRNFPYLYVKALSGGSSRRQPGGPRNACQRGFCSENTRSRPTSIDLYGTRLGFSWEYAGVGETFSEEVRLDTVDGPHKLVEKGGGGGLTAILFRGVGFESGWLYWGEGCFGDPGGCPHRHGIERYRYSAGTRQHADATTGLMGHDRDGGFDYVLADTSNGGFCDQDPPRPDAVLRPDPQPAELHEQLALTVARVLAQVAEGDVEDRVDQPDDERRPDARPEVVDLEVAHQPAGDVEHQQADHEQREAEREDDRRDGEDGHDRPDEHVHPREHQAGDHQHPEAVAVGDAVQDLRRDPEGDDVERPGDDHPAQHAA